MARQKLENPKVQRGISLPRDLYDAISCEADKYGRTWNETVELVLRKAFCPAAPVLQKKPATGHNMSGPAWEGLPE